MIIIIIIIVVVVVVVADDDDDVAVSFVLLPAGSDSNYDLELLMRKYHTDSIFHNGEVITLA